MSQVDVAIVELDGAAAIFRQRLVQAPADRAEIDETILDWAKGIRTCLEILKAAHRGDDADARTRALEAADAYLSIPLPNELHFEEDGVDVSLLREAAKHLCLDLGHREHQVEIQRLLASSLEDLIAEAAAADGAGLPEAITEYACGLAQGLSTSKGVPDFMREYWREWAALLMGDELPLPASADGPPVADDAHRLLRQFLQSAFLAPASDELPAHLRAGDTAEELLSCCATCSDDTKCADATGKSVVLRTDEGCPARQLAVNNAGFPRASGGDGAEETTHYYDAVIQQNQDRIDSRLYEQRQRPRSGWGLSILQRWNSYTPAMGTSEGGGYFLYRVPSVNSDDHETTKLRTDVGLVIDPGYGFLRNYFSEGYGVLDVTGVVVTHDHPDHLVDFEPLVNLLLESQKDRSGNAKASATQRKVDVLLSAGAFDRLQAVVETTRDVFRDTFVRKPMSPDFDKPVPFRDSAGVELGDDMVVTAQRALHRDASDLPHRHGHDSIGVSIEVREDGMPPARIAIPSDTEWSERVVKQYFLDDEVRSDVVCLHLGGMAKKTQFGVLQYFCAEKVGRDVLHKGWHLYLPGVLWFLDRAIKSGRSGQPPVLVILSEFGEEMSHGLRVDLSNRLNRYVLDKRTASGKPVPVVVVPGDVGLLVDPINREIQCSCCGNFFSWDKAFKPEVFGDSEQIFYVCAQCERALSQDERHALFRRRQAPLVRPVVA